MSLPPRILRELWHHRWELDYNNTSGIKVNFAWGTKGELDKHIASAKGSDSMFPLIFLTNSFSVENPKKKRGNIIEVSDARLLICARGNQKEFYDQRLQDSFEMIHVPIYEKIEESFMKDGGIRRITPYSEFYHPNYSKVSKSETNDIWDVLELELSFKIFEDCFKNKVMNNIKTVKKC